MSNVKISQLDPYIPDSQDGYGNVWIPCVKESGDTLIAALYIFLRSSSSFNILLTDALFNWYFKSFLSSKFFNKLSNLKY